MGGGAMTGYPVNLDVVDASFSWFDRIIEWLLISLLVFMPIAFGAVEAWSEEVVIALVAAISISFLLKLVFENNTRLIWSWAYVPITLFILVAAFQLIPLPTSLVNAISPNTVATKRELLSDLPHSGVLLESMTLSFYPNATRHDLRFVLAVAAVFFVVVNVYRRPDRIKRLLAAIAIIGGSIAVLALMQNVIGNGRIYWMVPTGHSKAYSGTFINHSHYGQFMNLSIGAALALIMVKLHESFAGKEITPATVAEYLSSHQAKILWLLVGMIILGMTTVVVSLSRGGMLSMLIAGAVTTLVLSASKSLRGRSWIIVLLALGAFIGVLFVGFDAVCDRLATLRQFSQVEGGRWQIVKDIATAWTKFPLLGTGLGTHEVVYPMFDRATIPALASHAENEYAQTAEETGIIGLTLLLAFWVSVWISQVRIVTNRSVPMRSAAYGLGFGLVAIMVHSLSDFGQHLPANAFLTAISCGLLVCLADTGKKSDPSAKVAAEVYHRPTSLRIISLVCVSIVFTWALSGANRARIAEAHWAKALAAEHTLSRKGWLGSDEEYVDLIRHAAVAADYEPDNINYRHWLNVYRWHSISRMTEPNKGTVIIPKQVMKSVRRIVRELHDARLLCPTYGATYSVVGQLEKFILDNPDGAELIRKGFRLAPSDPTACFVAGLLDAEEGKTQASYAKLSRAVQLDGRMFSDAVRLCIGRLDRPDFAVTLAGESTYRLSHVADVFVEMEEHKELADEARAQVVTLLKEKCSQPDAPAAAFASMAGIYGREGDNEAAIEHYRRALALDYSKVQWRFNLARLLAETDRIPEAIHEARIGLRLRPRFKAAERLIADLSVLPGAVVQESPPPLSTLGTGQEKLALGGP
jgi:tetratricopeptide (TPR) repeat protein